MSTVYVKVSTAINYPPVGHEVLWLNQNGEVFKGRLEEFEDNHSWVNCTGGESLSVFDFEYWLREVELPGEEEIKQACDKFYLSGEDPNSNYSFFEQGIRHILTILNPTHNESGD